MYEILYSNAFRSQPIAVIFSATTICSVLRYPCYIDIIFISYEGDANIMKCEKCGADIIDTAKFCPSCGYKIKKQTRTLECSKCGGLMEIDSDSPVITCPYCGNKELLQESDKVTRQRIRSKTVKNISKDVKDLGIQYIETKERQKREKQKRDIKLIVGTVILIIIIILFCCIMSIFE